MDSGAPNRGNLKLVLCGSTIAFMSELLAERNPLYGRQTGVFDIAPLSLRETAAFFPAWSAEDIVTAFGILGGIPYYLESFDPDAPLERNIIDVLLARHGKLAEEPAYLMASETPGSPRFFHHEGDRGWLHQEFGNQEPHCRRRRRPRCQLVSEPPDRAADRSG